MKIGHRGAMGYELENTLESINKAIELGVDGIEIDVFKIKSGEIVVFHDEYVDKLTDGSGKIEDYNLKDLKKLKLLNGSRIPLLEDVLDLLDEKYFLNIELKGLNTAETVECILKDRKNILISSFNWDELKKTKLDKAILIEGNPLLALKVAKEMGAIAINPDYNFLTLEIIDKIHKENLKIYTWVVNDKINLNVDGIKLNVDEIKLNVDGIISDYPDKI